MKICIFEDTAVSNLYPVNYLRHTSELISGIYPLHIKTHFLLRNNFEIVYHARNYLQAYLKTQNNGLKINTFEPDEYVFLNARVIFTQDFIEGFFLALDDIKNSALIYNNTVIAFHVTKEKLALLSKKINPKENNLISVKEIKSINLQMIRAEQLDQELSEELIFINYPHDLLNHHEQEMKKDMSFLFKKIRKKQNTHTKAELINPKNIYISPDANISNHAVLNASKGPIFISEGCTIEPFSYIEGPVFIGENSTVKASSRIYGPVRIGEWCKTAGEISSSILHSYVNKQHHGFIGNTYLCEWVNLGAGTTTSNLKNNYSEIVVDINGKQIKTGSIFLGSIIGDYTKTGINTMLNTGTITGISCNLYGSGYHPKKIKSFTWSDAGKEMFPYELTKAIRTAGISMKRRNVTMNKEFEKLFEYLYKSSR
jgi:UDP-N-acetylglucosamine diphosphorylase/glucosamine-1-phosphate N-acetyltransferase